MAIIVDSNLTPLSLDTGEDLTGSSAEVIIYNKPDGSKGSWTGTVNETSIEYETSNGDIDVSGIWQLQAGWIQGGKQYYSSIHQMIVAKRIYAT